MTHSAAAFPFNGAKHRPPSSLCRPLRLLIVAICFSLSQPFAAPAQTNDPAPLPSAAQEALNKGIIAARVPDYPLAIRYFEEARKLAPQAPVIFMNLGVAESKTPGRELRAIAWFGAYLAASPDAPNAAAVKEQIAVLEVRNQSNLSRLIKTVQDAAVKLPATTYRDGLFFVNGSLPPVAILWAKAGDIKAALKVAELLEIKNNVKASTQRDISNAQAASGDIAGAQRTADLIQNASYKSEAQAVITEALAKTQPAIQPVVKASDWLEKLDDAIPYALCPLNTEPFLDLAGHLKSLLVSSNKPTRVFYDLHEAANRIISAQSIVTKTLKQQAIR